ncbi:4,5-dihydroxyphthalate dehydrogenase [Elysia marginata]|uniref:4,5-dihydroxyphthalate dehydrogenase n=1 Tax=Elysia marginata TaxID=1093978 RepID=A0AAV4GSB6_9GAST|nr:4,5-dihydroxyphthalate dehydrogenase [Elysia marginata]
MPPHMSYPGCREQRKQVLGLCNLVSKSDEDWREAAKKDKFADFVIITTTDQQHKDPVVAFARKGYDILLEKPMAVTPEDCKEIVDVCKASNVTMAVCHVLRYTPWVTMIKDVIDSGRIGDVVNIRLTEPVGFWHFAHSFVRGNWCKEGKSTFALMSKSCHDVDLIAYWMNPRKCVSVSSFGKLSHFTKSNKPAQASSRCLDCPVEQECPYSARKIYIDAYKSGNTGWPVKVITDIVDLENITKALRTGPYGKCVYDMDNDVVSHQVVNFQFDDGATANFSMVAFTKNICAREVKVYGTKGEITYEGGWDRMHICDFRTGNTEYWPIENKYPTEMAGHGGADFQLMKTFIEALKNGTAQLATNPEATLRSHLLVFAAEKARLENKVVTINADGDFVVQQDEATAHTSRATQQFLIDQGVDFVAKDGWPPQSPDSNPMDYAMWDSLAESEKVYMGQLIPFIENKRNKAKDILKTG